MKTLKTLALCVLISSGSAWAGETVDRTIAADADAAIEIQNIAGSLTINGWEKNEIKITGTLGDDVEELAVEGKRDRFEIDVEIPEGRSFGKRDIDADLEIWVPAGSGLEIETISASITVSGVNSWLELSSVSGNIEATGSITEAEIESVNGSIRLTGNNTVAEVESVNGNVELQGIGRAVDVSTVSGTITVAAEEVNRASFESINGRIEFDGSLSSNARFDVECHSSNVTLTLPAATGASFEISTFSGNIDSAFGGTVERTSRYAPGKRSEFSTGGGGARVSIESFSGNVELLKK